MAATKSEKTKMNKLFPNEPLVTINIPVTRGEKEDIWVAVNGKPFQIQRGIDVEVPRCVAKALEHKQKMLVEAMKYESALQGNAKAKELE